MVRLRGVVFCLIASMMLWGPFYRQVLFGRSVIFQRWAMYPNNKHRHLYAVEFRIRTQAGEVPIDHFKLLGIPRGRHVSPPHLWKIARESDLWELVQRICDASGPEADIRLYARLVTYAGWSPVAQGERNICRQELP